MKYDVAIVGAGPSGMMAAITAARSGKRVALIERNPQLGRKLLATGNGRCNLTNKQVTIGRYHGTNLEFIETVLSQFDHNATIKFFQELGLIVKEEANGRIFPRTNQASSVVEVLKQCIRENGIDVMLGTPVERIDLADSWRISLGKQGILKSDKLIIATGGRSAHFLGSTGDGFIWAKQMKHSLTCIYAALVPIETVEHWPKEAQGIKVEARVWATSGNKRIGESFGDVLFTSYGVSGPAVMAQAGGIAPLLRTSKVLLHIDLFPDMTEDQLVHTVLHTLGINDRTPLCNALVGLLPSGIIPIIIRLAGLAETDKVSGISQTKRLDIARTLKDLTLTVSKLRPLKEAQVTSGGINNEEIDPQSLESRLVKGLYFAGEILDADGDSGGFNLQWAWSSGYVAGRSLAS